LFYSAFIFITFVPDVLTRISRAGEGFWERKSIF